MISYPNVIEMSEIFMLDFRPMFGNLLLLYVKLYLFFLFFLFASFISYSLQMSRLI